MNGSSCVVSVHSRSSAKAHIGRNPATGAVIQVSDKGYAYFRPGQTLRDRVN
jgi:nucleoid DNA-binding protein